ncbi:MAG: hypothetical protein IJW69_04725, partial [Clostridia bacterium]|nr:hypothetical protein [Clostridia bacterium]
MEPQEPFRVRFATSVNNLVLHQRRKFASQTPNCYGLDRNFYCMDARKLYVILGRKAAAAVFRQRKAHKTDKESSLSFRFVAFAR